MRLTIIGFLFLLLSCKSASVIREGKANESLAAKDIVAEYYKTVKNFSTLYIKAAAKYKDANQSHNVQADIRIKKDEMILVSVRFLGITMAKALITPAKVSYYEKINNQYFEGDYTTLSRWLGTDLDYNKVQNLLIGQAMDDLTKGNYKATIEEKLYRLSEATAGTEKSFYFEAAQFLIKRQQIIQPAQQRNLNVEYPNHTAHPQAVLPTAVLIEATQKKGRINIGVDYQTVTFNQELSFPYSVPSGYDRIYID